jgi:formylglycine-generating enzyme required for sulfatase activity
MAKLDRTTIVLVIILAAVALVTIVILAAVAAWLFLAPATVTVAPLVPSTPTAAKVVAVPTPTVTRTAPPAPVLKPPVETDKDLTLDLGGGVSMKLMRIPAGNLVMETLAFGDHKIDRLRHEVTLSKPFFLGMTEVTQIQYEAVMSANPSAFQDPVNPVDSVSWLDAQEFCARLSRMCGRTVRLPTESEWEYACRAGTFAEFPFEAQNISGYCWFTRNSEGTTHPVAIKRPNAWSLYDMNGNVMEWCSDWFGRYPEVSVTDPQGPDSGTERILRGGSWTNGPERCQSDSRYSITPDSRNPNFGFRVAIPAGKP